jgi:NAD(P)H-hydrate epimerase
VRELSEDHLSANDLQPLKELIVAHDVVVMGMGLGRHPDTRDALARIIPLTEKVVIDADALLPGLPLKGLVTPHAGEFQRISGISLIDLDYKERTELVRGYARERAVTILLKGKVALITDGEIVRANTTGNPGMTVGGTGDVLAGIAAAFYARASALRAASAAAFVNGRAGDLVYLEKGFGMLATDVVEMIPQAMRF